MKLVLQLLEISGGIEKYRQIYNFEEPLDSKYVAADKKYAEKVIDSLERRIESHGMSCDFPRHLGPRRIDRLHLGQTTLHNYPM